MSRPTRQRGHLMDAAYYEDLAGRLYGLVIRLSDRLQERDDMLSLARQMEIDARVSGALRSCPHAD
jgi:hypothetical protein